MEPHFFNDTLVASKDADEHPQHLGLVFELLQSHDHYSNPTKCVLEAASLEFLGHLVDKEGIRPLAERVGASPKYSQLGTQHGLRQFLGLINFYHRFIQDVPVFCNLFTVT